MEPPAILAGWRSDDPGLTAVAHAIAAALEADARLLPEPAYHNRHHVAEAVLAMDLLCRTACELGLLPQRVADLGTLAMIGHDLGHDGSLAPPGLLEARAAAAVATLASALDPSERAVLTDLIMATDPTTVPDNLARARSADATPLDHLTALANEADVLASLLPGLGLTLADLLAAEWRPHDPERAASVTSFVGRRQFLSVYADPTEAGRCLGLQDCIGRQIAAITVELDALPRLEAVARFKGRL
jgi:predicted metal-dependent HD superfamily phosphohydrolase